jgi:hypothetical protein
MLAHHQESTTDLDRLRLATPASPPARLSPAERRRPHRRPRSPPPTLLPPRRRLARQQESTVNLTRRAESTADLDRLRLRYSCLSAGLPIRPRDAPALIARPNASPLAVTVLSWLGGDLRPYYILGTLLPALFPSLTSYARKALSAASRPARPRSTGRSPSTRQPTP